MAVTGAPCSRSTPVTMAVWPWIWIRAPMRRSSGTWVKRFSNRVSVTVAVPSAVARAAIIGAWRSVGKPG